jgi:hypothetical protein
MRFRCPIIQTCPCGSGAPRSNLRGAHGIFCTFVCDACEPRKRRQFNPRIFDARLRQR